MKPSRHHRPDGRRLARVHEQAHARSVIAQVIEDEDYDFEAYEREAARERAACGCWSCLQPSGEVRLGVLQMRLTLRLGWRRPELRPTPTRQGLAPVAARDPDELVRALDAHLRFLAQASGDEIASAPSIREAAFGSSEAIEAYRTLLERWRDRSTPVLTVLLLAPFWVRPLEGWLGTCDPRPSDEDVRSLVRHLFVAREVPEWAYSCWTDHDAPSLRQLCQFVLLAQGGSLHRAARTFGWFVPKRFTHALLHAQGATSWGEATRKAMIACLRGDDVIARLVEERTALHLDPTITMGEDYLAESDRQAQRDRNVYTPSEKTWIDEAIEARDLEREREGRASDLAFWFDAVEWLVRHRARLDEASMGRILDWAIHRHTEVRRRYDDGIGWEHLTARAATEHADAYARAIAPPPRAIAWQPPLPLPAAHEARPPQPPITWPSHGWSQVIEDADDRWELVELTSADALAEEGAAMHHCVLSYAGSCSAGLRAIFSLRRDGKRHATIEVDVATRRVVQARGACNGKLPAREEQIVLRWAGRVLEPSDPARW